MYRGQPYSPREPQRGNDFFLPNDEQLNFNEDNQKIVETYNNQNDEKNNPIKKMISKKITPESEVKNNNVKSSTEENSNTLRNIISDEKTRQKMTNKAPKKHFDLEAMRRERDERIRKYLEEKEKSQNNSNNNNNEIQNNENQNNNENSTKEEKKRPIKHITIEEMLRDRERNQIKNQSNKSNTTKDVTPPTTTSTPKEEAPKKDTSKTTSSNSKGEVEPITMLERENDDDDNKIKNTSKSSGNTEGTKQRSKNFQAIGDHSDSMPSYTNIYTQDEPSVTEVLPTTKEQNKSSSHESSSNSQSIPSTKAKVNEDADTPNNDITSTNTNSNANDNTTGMSANDNTEGKTIPVIIPNDPDMSTSITSTSGAPSIDGNKSNNNTKGNDLPGTRSNCLGTSIGVLAFVAFVVIGCAFFLARKRKRDKSREEKEYEYDSFSTEDDSNVDIVCENDGKDNISEKYQEYGNGYLKTKNNSPSNIFIDPTLMDFDYTSATPNFNSNTKKTYTSPFTNTNTL